MKKNAKPQLESAWWKVNQPKGLNTATELGKALANYERAAALHKKSKSEESYQACANCLDLVDKATAKAQKEALALIKKPPQKGPFDADDIKNTVDALKKYSKYVALARSEQQSYIEDDEEAEDEGNLLTDPAAYGGYLKKNLKKALRAPLNFAIGLIGSQGEDQRMLFHKSKAGKVLAVNIKKETGIKKLSWGVVGADTDDSGTMVLALDGKRLPGMAIKAKKMLKAFKPLPFSEVKLIVDGEEVADLPETDSDEDADEITPSGEKTEADWKKLKAALVPKTKPILESEGPLQADALKYVRAALKAENAGQYENATKIFVEGLVPLLKKGQAQKMSAVTKAEVYEEMAEKRDQETALFAQLQDHNTYDTLSAVPDNYRQMESALTEMLARAEALREAGADMEEQVKVFEHIPRNFWPLAFKKELQDWRVTRDAMNDIAVKKMFEEAELTESIAQGAELFSTVAEGVGGVSELVFSKEKAKAVGEVVGRLKQIGELTKLASDEGGSIKKGRTAEGPVQLKLAQEELMEAIVGLTKLGVDIAGEFIPWLGAAQGGAQMLANLKEAWDRNSLSGATSKLQAQAAEEEQSTDSGGQLSRAFNQAQERESSLRNRAGFDAVTDAIGVAEKVATGSVVGVKVGAALKVVGKTVTIGGKVVVSAIDWSAAADAMDTLHAAQAGDEESMQTIFERHSHYAKLLIAISAKEGSQLAREYFVDRGLTEDDLAHPATSMEILYEFGLKRSKETEAPATFSDSIKNKLEKAQKVGLTILRPLKSLATKIGIYKELTPEEVIERSNDPGIRQVYSPMDIKRMISTLREAESILEQAGEDAPKAVVQNITNLRKVLGGLARENADQITNLLRQKAEMDVIRVRWEGDEVRRETDPVLRTLPSMQDAILVANDTMDNIQQDIDALKEIYVDLRHFLPVRA